MDYRQKVQTLDDLYRNLMVVEGQIESLSGVLFMTRKEAVDLELLIDTHNDLVDTIQALESHLYAGGQN